jgi:hypothetical protein
MKVLVLSIVHPSRAISCASEPLVVPHLFKPVGMLPLSLKEALSKNRENKYHL